MSPLDPASHAGDLPESDDSGHGPETSKHGAPSDRERYATLAAEIYGGTSHAIRKRDVDRFVGAIDDRLAELRALSVGRSALEQGICFT